MADVEQSRQRPSLPSQLRAAEPFWTWKVSLRIIVCIINIVAIGCAAWIVANTAQIDSNPYIGYFEFEGSSIGALIVLSVSFLWCLLCIIIPFILKPPRPIHPGVAVGIDLVLWLGFIVVGLFSAAGLVSLLHFGSDPNYLADPSYRSSYQGNYYLAPNNTWVYNVTYAASDSSSYYYNYTTGEYVYPTGDVNNVTRDCSPEFTSCAELDADINRLWQEKPRREGVEIVMTAVQWLDVLLHFALFVWACIDTHKRNSWKKNTKEQIVADKIMADLERRGFLNMYNRDTGHYTGASQPQMSQTYPPQESSAQSQMYTQVAQHAGAGPGVDTAVSENVRDDTITPLRR